MTIPPMPLHDHLRAAHGHKATAAGDNVGKFLLWSNFVGTAVEMLREAERRLNDPTVAAVFKARKGWHRKRASRDGRGGYLRIPDEDAVTDALVELMKQAQVAPAPGAALARRAHVGVFSQQKRRKQRGIGGSGRLNTDIAIYLADQPALDLRIEAKVLAVPGDVASAYCSADGLLRFADHENPYTVEWVGGMVAYCFALPQSEWDAKVASAMGSVHDVLRVRAATVAGLPEELLVTDVANAGSPGVVTVFHLGMGFPAEQADPAHWPPKRGRKAGHRPIVGSGVDSGQQASADGPATSSSPD